MSKVKKKQQIPTGHVSSVGVPRASKILVSWSRSESPARNGIYIQDTYRGISMDTKITAFSITVSIISLKRGLCTRRSNSAKMQPTAHMSTPTPYILAPNRSSGERYHLGKGSIHREFNFSTLRR